MFSSTNKKLKIPKQHARRPMTKVLFSIPLFLYTFNTLLKVWNFHYRLMKSLRNKNISKRKWRRQNVIKHFLTETASLRRRKGVPTHAIKRKARGYKYSCTIPFHPVEMEVMSAFTPQFPLYMSVAGCQEAVWTFRRMGKSLAPTGNQNVGVATYTLRQWWANYGPRVRYGPLKCSIRPARHYS